MREFIAGQETIVSRTMTVEAASSPSSPPEPPLHLVPASGQSADGSIRSFERRDVPRVCALFLKTFRKGKTHRVSDLAATVEATYLTSPAYSPDVSSIVHLDASGQVDGFLGIINISLRLGERRLRGGILSAFMADGPEANPAIGVRLSRAMSVRPFDLLFTDTANRTSLDISRAMRFDALPSQSLEWMKMLNPAGTGAYLLGRKFPRLGAGVGPLARVIDAALPTFDATAIDTRTIEGTVDRPLSASEFVAEAPPFLSDYALRPAWDEPELTWLMTQAGQRKRNGPLHIREVLDRNDRRIGLYLLYAKPGSVALALQVLARRGRSDLVLGSLLAQAKRAGAVAVRGATSPDIVRGLLRQNGVLYRGGMNTIVRTADREIARALNDGDFFLGGLAGETWARLFADDFS